MSAQSVYDELKDFEKRCNNRSSSLMAFSVLYEAVNEKGETVVHRTVMACPSAMHVVVRFPKCVKMELLADAYVTIAPIIIPPAFGNEGDEEIPAPRTELATPRAEPQPIEYRGDGVPKIQPRRVPLLPGLVLCKQCKYDPFKNPHGNCSKHGHRFDKDPATKRCELFEFP